MPDRFSRYLPSRVDAERYWPAVALVGGIVGWFIAIERTYGPPPSSDSPPVTPSVLLLYASIIAISVALTEIVRRNRPWRWTRLAGHLLTAAAVFTWGYYDRYESEWQRENVRYTDTHHRWSGRLFHREMGFYKSADAAKEDSFGFKEDFSLEGPMAGTGKPHGQWKWQLGLDHWSDAIKNGQPYQKTIFYWYGDEISEGDWHLRNHR